MAWTRDEMAARAAREVADGAWLSLGTGIPRLVARHLPASADVRLHENGALRVGRVPAQGGVEALPETACFSTADSFAMIRGGHVDLAMLGGMQVAANGDLANWMAPGQRVRGIGGAMDLVAGVRRIVVLMEHVDRRGAPKLVERCAFPLTGAGVVDLLVTDLGVFRIDRGRSPLTLLELAPGVSLEDVRRQTEPAFAVACD